MIKHCVTPHLMNVGVPIASEARLGGLGQSLSSIYINHPKKRIINEILCFDLWHTMYWWLNISIDSLLRSQFEKSW